MRQSLKKAQEWAQEVWSKSVKNWKTRNQDYNYKRLLARPGVEKSIKTFRVVRDGIFLDVGCGEGSETRHIRDFLVRQGYTGTFYCFDQQKELIQIAQATSEETSPPITLVFDYGRTGELVEKYDLQGKVDRAFSTFLLQDMPDVERYFETMSLCLKKSGGAIFLLVDPYFGKAMLEKGVLKVNRKLQSELWRWAAEYPIVEEGGKTFYAPYFHRELEDYLKLLYQHFSDVTLFDLRPSNEVIEMSKRDKISPFYDHPGNVYYPEILEIPSSLFLLVTK